MPLPTLESRLETAGCDQPIAEFQDRIAELHTATHPSWSVDELLLHPRDALAYCDEVRRMSGFQGLPDDLILRCLIARRKHP